MSSREICSASGKMAQQQQAAPVGPLQIVEDENHGLGLRHVGRGPRRRQRRAGSARCRCRCPCSPEGPATCGPPRARGAPGPIRSGATCCASWSSEAWATKRSNASTKNLYGLARSSSQCPNRTSAPSSKAPRAAAAANVVLPRPASPAMRTTSRPPSAADALVDVRDRLQLVGAADQAGGGQRGQASGERQRWRGIDVPMGCADLVGSPLRVTRAWRLQLGRLSEDRQFQRLERLPRIDPELVEQQLARLLVASCNASA